MKKRVDHTVTSQDVSDRVHLGVMGSPISHSVSPVIHSAAYETLQLDWEYEKRECVAAELSTVLDGLDNSWRGLSLTMPLKEQAHRIARTVDPLGQLSGVVNTLKRTPTGWDGWNTDIQGLARVIVDSGAAVGETLVIGTGATAVSAVLAAFAAGAHRVSVWGRREEAVEALVQQFNGLQADMLGESPWTHMPASSARVLDLRAADRERWTSDTTSLVVSTLPGSVGSSLRIPDAVKQVPLVDVAYDPWPSPLACRWEAAGGSSYSGLAMLVYQALLQIRVFVSGDVTKSLPHEEDVLRAMRSSLHMGG